MVSLFCHIGLGDLILLSGAIVELTRLHGAIRIYCYRHHSASVRSFFANHPGVAVTELNNPGGDYGVPPESHLRPVEAHIIRTGCYAGAGQRPDISFPELFYQQLAINYADRWRLCPIEKAAEAVPQLSTEIPVFVHDDPSRGYHIVKGITGKPVYRPSENGGSILQFVDILRRAKEIHVMDSSFYHLVESLEGISAALYYHRYARRYVPKWFDYPKRHAWQVLP